MLMLDAAFPPHPLQWVADMESVNADGGFVYVVGDFLHYTAEHVSAARAARKVVIPIVVPGNTPTTVQAVHDVLVSYGFESGPVIVDLEPGSEPADEWVRGLRQFLDPLGYETDRYGTSSVLGQYSPEDDDWVAAWQRNGVLDPVPTLPAGWNAWQFVDDVVINGSTYDVSVVDDQFVARALQEDIDLTPDQDKTLTHINEAVSHVFDFEFYEGDGQTGEPAIVTQLKRIETAANAAAGNPAASAQAIADALSNNAAFVQALAKAVVVSVGKALSGTP